MTIRNASGEHTKGEATADRRRWMGVLARATEDELAAAWKAVTDKPGFRWLRRPETGMVMASGRIGGTGQPFNLGEVSVVRCALEIDGGSIGVCYAHGRDHRHAEHAALLDALLQDAARRPNLERDVIGPLEQLQRRRREAKAREAGATRVEFFTMVRGEDDPGARGERAAGHEATP